jgi:hypothetical protein
MAQLRLGKASVISTNFVPQFNRLAVFASSSNQIENSAQFRVG